MNKRSQREPVIEEVAPIHAGIEHPITQEVDTIELHRALGLLFLHNSDGAVSK